jgi:hypothetical protein
MAKHICFYSNSVSDKWSKAFLEELSKTPWVNEFKFVCVDPGPNRPSLPKWLKQVPTLVIEGDKDPIKIDTEVMNWLYERKLREVNRTSPSEPSRGGGAAATPGGEVQSWGAELDGFGNTGYSFINSDTSAQGNGGMDIPGSFAYLNGGASPGDRTGQGPGAPGAAPSNTAGRSRKEKLFDEQMEMYKQQRDMGMPQGPRRM